MGAPHGPAHGLGWHWLAEASGCGPALDDPAQLDALLLALAQALGLTVMEPPRVREVRGGLAGVALLGESHAAVHTDGARRQAFVDVFSCAPLDPDRAEATLRAALHPTALHARLVRR